MTIRFCFCVNKYQYTEIIQGIGQISKTSEPFKFRIRAQLDTVTQLVERTSMIIWYEPHLVTNTVVWAWACVCGGVGGGGKKTCVSAAVVHTGGNILEQYERFRVGRTGKSLKSFNEYEGL